MRRIPPDRRREVQKLLDEMLTSKVIEHSKSPWASPIVLVRKKDNSLRFCVDYRKLNTVTHKDAYPLPRIDDTLAGSKWFSALDLLSGYWQVEVAEGDRQKTAFCTMEGLFEFRVMPFGLCNAPATFQRLMDLVLAGLQWSHCLVYLDDVIILGTSFEEHLANLQLVFDRLQQAGLKLKPKKCNVLKHRVQYLGHIVSDKGVQADPSKIEKVASWPIPVSTKEVQQFLGLAGYYRRFIKDCAKIARPLHKLTEQFKWTNDCLASFDMLKQKLTTAPVLTYPDYSKPFILDTDASDTGIGAVLSQVDNEGNERVVAYASRLLSKPERQYCVTKRELLAVVAFTRHFRPFLSGRPFVLRMDHGSLTWLKNFKEPEGQMARWLERLQEFDFTIEHRQGRKHTNADSLSRLPCRQCGRGSHTNLVPVAATFLSGETDDIKQLQLTDQTVGPVLKLMIKQVKPCDSVIKSMSRDTQRLYQIWDQLIIYDEKLYRQFQPPRDDSVTPTLQLVVPECKREEVMNEMHAAALGGHLGEEKTLARIRERFYCPGYHKDVCEWCKLCPDCASVKTPPTMKTRLKEAYDRVRNKMGHQLDRQKDLYDRRVHGEPYKQDDLVWLHSKVVPKGVGRKLYRPWTGPFRVIKKLSDSVYRIQNTRSAKHRLIVHFDRLKRCPRNIRLPAVGQQSPPDRNPTSTAPTPPGTNLEQVDIDDDGHNSPPAPRYPQRHRFPPTRLIPVVEH